MAVAGEEGVPDFVLNARTDAFLRAGDRDPAEVLADAVQRGRAFLDAGAPAVFVPGKLDEQQVSTLVEDFGPQRLTVIGVPGSLPLARLEELGVARISFGPNPQRVALTALQELVESVHAGSGLPATMRILT
jgi:2-methylisocitrate lyase-like PEP mutase family enzyme